MAGTFNGSSDWVNFGLNAFNNLVSGSSAVSVALWVNLNGTFDGVNSTMFDMRISNARDGMNIRAENQSGDTFSFRVGGRSHDSDLYQVKVSSDTYAYNTKHLIVGILDFENDYIYLYVNGSEDNSGVVSFTRTTYTPENVTVYSDSLMCGLGNAGTFCGGVLYEAAIWNKVLTSNEISLLYNSKMKYTPMNIQLPDLVFYWFMEGPNGVSSDGDKIKDKSLTMLEGTMVGGTYFADDLLSYPSAPILIRSSVVGFDVNQFLISRIKPGLQESMRFGIR